MPEIANPYIYSTDFTRRLNEKFSRPDVTYRNWQDEDILDIRSSIREYYRIEQLGKCAYCYQQISFVSANNCQVEHIVPKSIYIKFILEPKNMCVICADCNQIKRDQEILNEVPNVTNREIIRYPRVSSSFKIIHPHFDNFSDHILSINGYYIDKTVKGGYTIVFCKLNRKLHLLGYETPIFSDVEIMQIMTVYLSEIDALKKMYLLKKLKEILILI